MKMTSIIMTNQLNQCRRHLTSSASLSWACLLKKIDDIDDDLATCEDNTTDWTKKASEILQELNKPQDIDDKDEEKVDDTTSDPIVLREEALTNCSILRTNFYQHCDIECLEHLQSIEKSLLKVNSTNTKQQSILQYFK